MEVPARTRRVRFGVFEVDLRSGELHKQGLKIKLQDQPFQILALLLEHPGEMVTREELHQKLWPADTFVDFDVGLNVAIKKLRDALGDSAENPRFVETLPRRGYRFIAPVEDAGTQLTKAAHNSSERATTATLGPAAAAVAAAAPAGERASPAQSTPVPSRGEGTTPTSSVVAAATPADSSVTIRIPTVVLKRWKILVPAALAVVAAVVFGLMYFRPAKALTERDAILLGDFVNTTGDPVFDGTLKQALAVQLAQSPFLHIFPEDRVRQTLRFMGRDPDERIVGPVARETCERQNIKAMLTGTIAALGTQYVITLEAANCQTGESLASEQVQASSKEEVLGALGKAASRLRGKLGESLGSIQKFDVPLRQGTTSSLEALKALTLGRQKLASTGSSTDAILFYKRALELDPNFAGAYNALGIAYQNLGEHDLAIRNFKKAFELRDRVSEPERLSISAFYYRTVTGEFDKAIETFQLWTQTYPREYYARNSLGVTYRRLGQLEKALENAHEALRLNPNHTFAYGNLCEGYMRLNRFEEGKKICEQGIARNLDGVLLRVTLSQIAFAQGDQAALERHAEAMKAKGGEGEEDFFALQADIAAFSGRAREARQYSRQAVEAARRGNSHENAATYAAFAAMDEALYGNPLEAGKQAKAALAIAHGRVILALSGIALALTGDTKEAGVQAAELEKRFPLDTIVQGVWLPTIRAGIELQRGNTSRAIELLNVALPYERMYWEAIYMRGQAYLRAQAGKEAAAEFQKIVDNRGGNPTSVFYPLAHLGLGRAWAFAGDAAKARKAYQDFFALWKDADPGIPVLKEAKAEYEKLK